MPTNPDIPPILRGPETPPGSDVFPPITTESPLTMSTHDAEMWRTLTIDKIFKLLVALIGSLQKTAAAQSNRFAFLTQWQKAYTDSMDQIHAFTAKNGDAFDDPTDTDQKNMRDNLNQVNSTYTEQLRSRRSVVSDDAKSLQTSINQSSDAVSQQTQMATSLLQQLSTILATIYR